MDMSSVEVMFMRACVSDEGHGEDGISTKEADEDDVVFGNDKIMPIRLKYG